MNIRFGKCALHSVSSFAAFFAVLCLSGFFLSCATTKSAASENTATKKNHLHPVYVTNSKKIQLLSPSAMNGEKKALQLLEGSYGNNSFSLMCYLEADSSGIYISLLNEFGTGMGELSYNGERVNFESGVFPKNAKAEYIVSDLQFAYYRAEELKAVFDSAGLKFTVSGGADEACVTDKLSGAEGASGVSGGSADLQIQSETRTIFDGEKCIERIVKNKNTITIDNYLRNYTYVLTEAE